MPTPRSALTGALNVLLCLAISLCLAALLSLAAQPARAQAPASRIPAANVPLTAESLAQGQQLYGTYCVVCHGPAGLGDGDAAVGLDPKPKDLSALPEWAPIDGLAGHIAQGAGAMPPLQDVLSPEEITTVAYYVKSLVVPGKFQPRQQGQGSKGGQAAQGGTRFTPDLAPIALNDESRAEGQALYNTYCFVCHGRSGTGDGAAAAGLEPKPRDLTALPEWAPLQGLAGHIAEGIGTMPPLKDALTEPQIYAVAWYVKSLVVPGKFQPGQGRGQGKGRGQGGGHSQTQP